MSTITDSVNTCSIFIALPPEMEEQIFDYADLISLFILSQVSRAANSRLSNQFFKDRLIVRETVPYVQDNIPPEVQARADEINQLQERFAALSAQSRPVIPYVYKDIVLGNDVMSIPVCDTSHAVFQRNIRENLHHVDKDAMEGHLADRRSWNPAKCPVCWHPTAKNEGILRANLRIDTGLQEQILAFLKKHLPA
jgi:hypothetical protein